MRLTCEFDVCLPKSSIRRNPSRPNQVRQVRNESHTAGSKALNQGSEDFKHDRNEGSFYGMAVWSALAGKNAQAMDYLEKSYERRLFMLAYVGADPIFENLHSMPRYQDLLRKMTGCTGR